MPQDIFGDKSSFCQVLCHYMALAWASELTIIIWRLQCQKQVSQTGISNCIPLYSVGCNYLSMPVIPASGTKIILFRWYFESVIYSSSGFGILNRDGFVRHISLANMQGIHSTVLYFKPSLYMLHAYHIIAFNAKWLQVIISSAFSLFFYCFQNKYIFIYIGMELKLYQMIMVIFFLSSDV